MNIFTQHNPTKLYFGKGQISQLSTEVRQMKVLLVYGGGSIKQNGVYEDVINELKKVEATIFKLPGVEPNPRLTTVYRGVEICKSEGIDILLAVGGGSVIDCTKAIAIGAKYDGDVWELITRKAPIESALPIGTVLTLAATGSEMNPISVISNWETKDKLGWGSPLVFPRFSILDPTYTFSVSHKQTVYGIVDSMSHALESYFHRTKNTPLIDAFIESLLRTAIQTAPKLLEDLTSYDHRETMMYLSTIAFNETLLNGTDGGDWGSHRIEHALSAVYDIPHGGGLAILFPNWLEHVLEEDPSRVKMLAMNVFGISDEGKSDIEVAKEGAKALRAFWNSLGAPSRLSDYDIDDRDIELIIDKTFIKPGVGLYKELDRESVRDILIRSM
ncbi:iron-containing alcohol dehydrogenase [Sporosarcina thermotolerans]|uniref:Iron-containing alcohol dehydrogenase n=1 Tax=Sporosarcina thermotolerans TaxID=633404 RepID=A0AAW9ABT3_9BACL|nr:iron-containing alcohol dehydrogenase [Sporosarcina thermotolerans]MDW0118514.1 iron-containing alcohol dehydrogenase [Sporosarcina thermotolerans]WHT49536.1 iron-containing alcohol dehydrogenase [Sporosarcina thermotolerans]